VPSPDATPYVDLRLYDLTIQQIFEGALANLQAYLPEWEPREGHMEVLLLESMALEVAEAVFAINRLPGAIMEILLRLYNVERDLGSPPTATIKFTVSSTAGHTIPAGTRVALEVSDEVVVFTTDAALAVPPGSTTGTVAATGDRITSIANGTPGDTALIMVDSVSVVDRADTATGTSVSGGAEEESSAEWFTRGVQRFSRLVETLVLPTHFQSAALEEPDVTRAVAIDNYDPAVGGGAGNAPGHVTVAVYGAGGVLSAVDKEALRASMDLKAQANLAVHVADPTITTVNVTATVVGVPGYTVAQVQANVTAELDAFLAPETWPWAGTVYRNELIALLDRVEGVERVTSISVPASDLALAGVAPLANLGTATITVTGI
jgi:uncharacterized phage protein gp47/JayE